MTLSIQWSNLEESLDYGLERLSKVLDFLVLRGCRAVYVADIDYVRKVLWAMILFLHQIRLTVRNQRRSQRPKVK